ncbi:RPAP1-like protein [Xylariaceae sp. FL1019]|nr:RPAP1-like protein [Xylariaceae sp. FL1019]
MASQLFVLDVKEKEIDEPKAPSFPQLRTTTTGFPEHKKRGKISAFKQKRQGLPSEQKSNVFLSSSDQPLSPPTNDPSPAASPSQPAPPTEKESIDRENNQKLASMSPREIEQARQQLFNGLDPSILQMLLKRANLDDGANASDFDKVQPGKQDDSSTTTKTPEIQAEDTSSASAPHSSELPVKATPEAETSKPQSTTPSSPSISPKPTKTKIPQPNKTAHRPDDDTAPAIPPADHIIQPHEHSHTHFPRAPQPSDLDPSDPNFLANLHSKYFPSLPADPSKLAWMAPVPTEDSPADLDSPYHPEQSTLSISSLRFDFFGALLPPRISRAIPVSMGLHHHGEAPESAGYTIAELARLCRSAVPGQRCMAYQTLGRILYRLGVGQFGGTKQDDVSIGLWRQIDEGEIMRSLKEEASLEEGRGHRSARAFAIEALWLFEKGGWQAKLKKATGI